MKGTNHITCPFENYSFSVHATIKVTHPEATFPNVSVTYHVIEWEDPPPSPKESTAQMPHTVFYDSASIWPPGWIDKSRSLLRAF